MHPRIRKIQLVAVPVVFVAIITLLVIVLIELSTHLRCSSNEPLLPSKKMADHVVDFVNTENKKPTWDDLSIWFLTMASHLDHE
jgi:hypothetical protein